MKTGNAERPLKVTGAVTPGEIVQEAGRPGTSGRVSHGFVVMTTMRNFWHFLVYGVQQEVAVVVVPDVGGYSKEALQQDILERCYGILTAFTGSTHKCVAAKILLQNHAVWLIAIV